MVMIIKKFLIKKNNMILQNQKKEKAYSKKLIKRKEILEIIHLWAQTFVYRKYI